MPSMRRVWQVWKVCKRVEVRNFWMGQQARTDCTRALRDASAVEPQPSLHAASAVEPQPSH
eukprot:275126-Chlamydomonas_euryale.AAC.1